MNRLRLIFILQIVFAFHIVLEARNIPVNLKCNFWENPQGIDVENPVLGWNIRTSANVREMHQTAYQVLVSSSEKLLKNNNGDLWNSGKVSSDAMGQIVYAGKPLLSSQKYWWKVRVWDEKGKASEWSSPAIWIMGIMQPTEWKAQWISATGAEKYAHSYSTARFDFNLRSILTEFRANKLHSADLNYSSMLLRKEFRAEKKLVRAVLHVSGMGQYELTLNGNKVGDYLLAPGWSYYPKTILYDTYDVTQHIKSGNNAIGLILSNGMYNIQPDSVRYVKFLNSYGPLKAILQLKMEYADGTSQIVSTDQSWKAAPGPITYMNQFGGEDFDARLDPVGWDLPGFNIDNQWFNAVLSPLTDAKLKGLSYAAPPVKAIEKVQPIKVTQLKPNVWMYDLGQNASFMPELTVKGPKGSFVRIIPSELLNQDGTVDRRSATQDGVRPAWWQYTLSSNNLTEKWFPKFFYQGGRYLQVELFSAEGDNILPMIENLSGVVVHTSAEPIGSFECSNELFNRIYKLVRWAQRSNLQSVITDCPHREKMPWLEQYHLNGPSLRYNYDLLTLFSKSMNDMSDSQLQEGLVPNIAPEFFHAGSDFRNNGFRNSPEWGSSFIIVPWQQYLYSGDVSLIKRYYESMKRYLSFLDASASENILNIGLGDWYDIGPKPAWGSQLTPVAFTATAIYFYDYQVMTQMATVIGKTTDALQFEQKAEAIRLAFNKKFYNPEKRNYATGSNTTSAIPLALNIAEPENRKALADSLALDIRRRGNAFNSGEVGYRFLLKALAMEGYSDVIYDMNNQSEKPGYGYQLKMGATSLTEKWDAGVGSFGSQNHFMSGQINEWFFHDLAGIGVEAEGAGFRKSIIKPTITGDLKWVKGSYKTVSGIISTEWNLENEDLSLKISIPANTISTVYVPAENVNVVKENGKSAGKSVGVKFLKYEPGYAVFEVASGNYHFESKIEKKK